MRAITPDLEAILKSKFQAGAHGFRGRVEVDVPTPSSLGACSFVAAPFTGRTSADIWGAQIGWDGTYYPPASTPSSTVDSNLDPFYTNGTPNNGSVWGLKSGVFGPPPDPIEVRWQFDLGTPTVICKAGLIGASYAFLSLQWSDDGTTWTTVGSFATSYLLDVDEGAHRHWGIIFSSVHSTFSFFAGVDLTGFLLWAAAVSPASVETVSLQPSRISLDKSRKMAAAQLEFVVPNEDGSLSRFPSQAVLVEDMVVRAFTWYGDPANEVKVFTGLIDKPHEHRDPRNLTVSCRDRMKLLLVQGFQASAPQGATEDGAVRTPANGVYLNMEVSAIVGDILDQAGITTGGRSIFPTSYMVDEYIIPDGSTWADAIAGTDRLTDLTGYELWADEDGVITFAPAGQLAPTDTDTARTADYTFRVGEDLMAIDLEGDDYDVKTRIKATGPQTTAKPAWAETWHTNAIARPVGLFYDPADPTHLYVLDRSTAKLYKLLQSDRSIVSSVAFAGISHPTGISGDPSDATIVWILEAPWAYGGSTSGDSIKKVRRSDGATLATYSIADGRWTTIKVSAAFIWLGNWDTDKVHKHSKVDGSSIASYTVTYESVAQTNPSGIAIDGTTLLTFFYGMSGGNRFLLVDESDPTTVDPTNALGVTSGVVSTAGTNIIGGEMDTTTHADLYACSDALGLVWKFALTTPTTDTVAVVVADRELEDLLGERSQTAARNHDLHPGDADHSFEIRRGTLALKVVTSVAQATESATRALNIESQFRLVLDAGVIGNPALQLRDMIAVEDPLSGLDESTTFWLLDTYRTELDAEAGTYVGTVSLLPWAPVY